MSYHREGLGAVATRFSIASSALKSGIATIPTSSVPAQGGSALPKLLFFGALGVGGILLYRHFKKKGSAPPAPSSGG